jgi:hypothetical protein
VYSRIINGEEHFFGVSGKLIRNVLVMFDRETETLWSQLLGEAVDGELLGTKLEFLPAVMTTWESWREMHPDTIAIRKGYFGDLDPYTSYYNSNSSGVIGSTNFDDRLGTKEFVIGVDIGLEAVAYPFSVLNSEPVVNDEVAGQPIVVAFDKETGAGAVWERTLSDGQILEFVEHEEFYLRDTETGSLWNGLTGQAIDGDYTGTTLERVKSTQSFWFGWVDFHEDTRLYGLD